MKTLSMTIGLLAMAAIAVQAQDAFKINGDAEKGAATFKLYCAACHGETGHGDGLAAAALNPKPRNLTDKAYMDTLTDEHIFKVIKEGGASVGLSAMMAPWGAILKTDEAVHDVAAYVRSLAGE
ncbi:MAG: c-type cytochrome [Verrucomicrobia bacterium]|nr:c-type cytochrome [Kiritimatiellia bacterium]MCP5487018.1 c-type cytochrome [Verrucomicrobiota bacterium]